MPFYLSLLCRKLYHTDTSHHCKLSYHLAAAPYLPWTGKVVKNMGFPAGVQETVHAQDLASSHSYNLYFYLWSYVTGTTLK